MAMTVNPDAGISAPDMFRENESLYAFRFDTTGDGQEDVTFKVRFAALPYGKGHEHKHTQSYEIRRAAGEAARQGIAGDLLLDGETSNVIETQDVRAYAGIAPDLFAGDAAALGTFRTALAKENRFAGEAWQNRKNFFANRNVTAIVLEVPTKLIGEGKVYGWATVSLLGHAPEIQVSRWGLPLITNVFIPDESVRETYNRIGPAQDVMRIAPHIAKFTEKVSKLAGSTPDPSEYAKQVVKRLCPIVLPYELDTDASFDLSAFNGRGLIDDVMDVMLTLASNIALSDGVAPDKARTRSCFPYFGRPYTPAEQGNCTPARNPATSANR